MQMPLDGIIGGFSCRDFSRANSKRAPGAAAVAAGTSPGRSADTLQGTLSVLQVSGADFSILDSRG